MKLLRALVLLAVFGSAAPLAAADELTRLKKEGVEL